MKSTRKERSGGDRGAGRGGDGESSSSAPFAPSAGYRQYYGGERAKDGGDDEPTARPGGAAVAPGYRDYYLRDGGGASLPGSVRAPMERAFGADLGDVRVHEDERAGQQGAAALADGDNLHFAPGQYDPESAGGRRVIGHELAHVVQQRRGGGARDDRAVANPALEHEADLQGARASLGEAAPVHGAAATAQPLNPADAEKLRVELDPTIDRRGLKDEQKAELRKKLPALLADAASVDAAKKAFHDELQAIMRRNVRALDENAHKEDEDGDQWPRSRFTGKALKPGLAVVSIAATYSASTGHSLVVFESFDTSPEAQAKQQRDRRRHKIYHLFPAAETPDQRPSTLQLLVEAPFRAAASVIGRGGTRPGKVFHPSNDEEYWKKYQSKATYRSWEVPLAAAEAAEAEARASMAAPPDFALYGWGGDSCAKWANKIAAHAGIQANMTSWMPAVPVYENSGAPQMGDEHEQWIERDHDSNVEKAEREKAQQEKAAQEKAQAEAFASAVSGMGLGRSLMRGGAFGTSMAMPMMMPIIQMSIMSEAYARRLSDEFALLANGSGDGVLYVDRLCLQALALDTVLVLFVDPHLDGELRHETQSKAGAFAQHRLNAPMAERVLGQRDGTRRQLDCLRVLLHTFTSSGDAPLRAAAMKKIGAMGGVADLGAVLPHVRHGEASDIHVGLDAIKAVRDRASFADQVAGCAAEVGIYELLHPRRRTLTADERTRALRAILARGKVKEEKKHVGKNRNEVYFLTFYERLATEDGKGEEVRGVYKPERKYEGKNFSSFSREVAAYEFDAQFAQTGLVPVTVERQLPLGGASVGSVQYMVPGATALGGSPAEGQKHDPIWDYDPSAEGKQKRQSPDYKKQKGQARTLLYLLGDPDKLKDKPGARRNLQNLLLDEHGRLWMIDNGYSLGAPPKPVERGVLKKSEKKSGGEVVDPLAAAPKLREVKPEEVKRMLLRHIPERDAQQVMDRLAHEQQLDYEKRMEEVD